MACIIKSIFNFFKLNLRNSTFIQENLQVHPDSLNDVSATRTLLMQQTENNLRRRATPPPNGESVQCPICLGDSELPVETNCGHLFCGNCIIQHWHVKTANILHTSISCPICRQMVTMMLPAFTLDAETVNNQLNRPIILNINKYNKKFSGMPRNYMDYIYDLPTLLRHSFIALFSLDGLAIWYRVRVVFLVLFALCYLLSPFDLIPETLFGIFGLIDDILIFLFLAVYITIIYRQIVANRT